jgi:integrase
MKLTAKAIASLTLPAGKDDFIVFDEDLHGFGYRLRRRGKRVRKTFVIQYRNASGRSRRLTIAPGALPFAAARKSAAEELAKVKLGRDPQGEKTAARSRSALNFRTTVDEFLADKRASWRASTEGQYRRILLTYCKPLHGKAIDEIKRADISPLLKRVEQERGQRSASLTRARLWTLYAWAMREGRLDINPVSGTREVAYDGRRERVLNGKEIASIWRAACDHRALFPRGGNFGHVLRLLMLTGCRRREVTGMRWCELDDKGNWTIPAERAKNGRAHTLPLPPAALAIIDEMRGPRWDGRDWERDEYVFSKRGGMNVNRTLAAVQKRVGFADWWIHDIRRTVATGMAEIGILPHVIECVLNHVSGFRAGVAGVYNKASYEREMAQALQRWSEHVLALADGRAEKVVPLRTA